MVAKIAIDAYVLSFIKIYSFFSFVFCCAKEGRVVKNKESYVATLKIFR